MEQLNSYWTNFREILFWGFVLKTIDFSQVQLKYDKNNRDFT